MGILSNIFGKKQTTNVKITTINLKYMGSVHGIDGFPVPNRIFDVNVPFQNKMGSDLLPDNLKGPRMKLDAISVSVPFKLLEVKPKLPIKVDYMSKVSLTLKIEAPNMNYEGPLVVNFGKDAKDTVVVGIKSVSMSYNGKTVDLPDSGGQLNLQKNQIFVKNLQLYNVVSFNDKVNAIHANEPFSIISTDPPLPLTADKKGSYVISVYIKAPDFNYAGALEIKLK